MVAALIAAIVLDLAPLPADQVKVVGTTEAGATAMLFCASGYCQDWFNQQPAAPETVTGLEYTRVATRYGWTRVGIPVVAHCAPDSTYASYIRPKTFVCSLGAS